MDTKPALMPFQKLYRLSCQSGPVTIKNLGIDKGLKFKITRGFQQPVPVGCKVFMAKSSAKYGS